MVCIRRRTQDVQVKGGGGMVLAQATYLGRPLTHHIDNLVQILHVGILVGLRRGQSRG